MGKKELHSKRQFTDAQLYIDGIIFFKRSIEYTNNLSKDFKIEFGQSFIIKIKEMITNFSLSYRAKEKNKKWGYGEESLKIINDIDIDLHIMMDASILPAKQISQLQLLLGNLTIQCEGWCHSLETKDDGFTVAENGL